VMRMIGPDIDAEFARHAIAERGFWKHALNRLCQELCRVFPKDVRGGGGFQPSRISCVASVQFGFHLIAGQLNLLRIHDDHVVSHIDIRRKRRPMLPT